MYLLGRKVLCVFLGVIMGCVLVSGCKKDPAEVGSGHTILKKSYKIRATIRYTKERMHGSIFR